MKRYLLIVSVVFFLITFAAYGQAVPKEYEDQTLTGGFQANHFQELWDLTLCDMTVQFEADMTGMVDDLGGNAHAWTALGIRTLGYPDFNPTWMAEGAGVWMASDYHWAANTFDPDPIGAPTQDIDDKFILQKGGGMGEGAYNLPDSPLNPGANHRVWFDRDGVDQWQALNPLAVSGGTYNTNGTYDIVLTLHADDLGSGTAFMTINGLYQGFETDGNWNTMELTPAGMTFTGDMDSMQLFFGMYGYGATHTVIFEDIIVNGCLGSVLIDGCDTGVQDQLVNGDTISGLITDCSVGAKNHGEFVSCVSQVTNDLKEAGLISGKDKGAIQRCAAQSSLP